MANDTKIVLSAEDKTQAAFASVQRGLRGMETATSGVSRAMGGLIPALSVGAFAAFVKSSIDAADNMRDLAIATGTSVEALASYELAAKQSGTSIDAVATGMGKLSVFMANNAAEAKRLGLTAQDPAKAFAQLADVLARVESPAQRNAIAAQALGKSYRDLMPLLSQGGDEIRRQMEAAGPYAKRMGVLAEQADKFNDSMAEFKIVAQSAGLAIANDLLPAMNNAIEQFKEGKRIFGGFWEALEVGTRNPLKSPGDHLKELRSDLAALEEKKASIKPTSISHILIAGIDEDIVKTKKFIEYYKLLRSQSLGLPGKGEMAAESARQRSQAAAGLRGKFNAASVLDKSTHAAKPQLDEIDPFRDQRNAALRDSLAERDKLLREEFEREARQIDQWGDAYAALNQMDREVSAQLGDAIGKLFWDPASRAYAAVDKDITALRDGLYRLQDQIEPERYAKMNEAINALSSARYKLADAEVVEQEYAAALAVVRDAEASLQSRVISGLLDETQARIDLRGIIGQQGEAMAGLALRIGDMLAQTADPSRQAQLQAMLDKIKEMQAIGQQRGAFRGMTDGFAEYARAATDTYQTMKDATKRAFQGMEDSLVEFVRTGKLSFGDLADSIISDLIRIQIQESITKPLAAAMGSFDFKSVFGFANGGAPGGVSAWKNQIVDRPTFFAFANGGVMGEAGPEAIMPLTRRNGRLGVDASGAGVTVNVINNAAGTKATTRERNEGGNRIIDVFVEQVKGAIAADIARGKGSIPDALSGTYGLNRVAGAY